jgi:hypothetical protein
MTANASNLLKLLKDYDSGKSQESDMEAQLASISIIGPVLKVMNDLIEQRLLKDYAIGGGVAVLYYAEPVLTYDFDVICAFPQTGVLIDPEPVFNYLQSTGYLFGKEDQISIEGVPVQLIPASEGLVAEALQQAVPVTISGVETKILSIVYLIAIMLQLYRPKDRAKLDILVNNPEVAIDLVTLEQTLTRYDLMKKWERYKDVG